jgi:hypothetical protein
MQVAVPNTCPTLLLRRDGTTQSAALAVGGTSQKVPAAQGRLEEDARSADKS